MIKTTLSCGMLLLAVAYFNAQTRGKVGINTTTPTETLDVKGKVRVQELYTEGSLTGTNNANFNATAIVTTNAQGVLGKKDIDINNLLTDSPWKRVGTTDKNAIPVSGLAMYSKYKTAIGDYSGGNSTIHAAFEVLDGSEDQFALRRGDYRWNFNAYTVNNNPFLTIVGRPNNKRLLSLSSLGALYLGAGMSNSDGSGANLILDGGTGTIGVGKNSTDYDLDVNGYTRISQLPTSKGVVKYYTSENGTRIQKEKAEKYAPTHMVVADANGVLGKQDFPTIPTIPTEPWQVAGSTTPATANNQKIYQNNKVGIGDYSGTDIGSSFEISGGGTSQLGLINGTTKWDISTEDKTLTFTTRKPKNGRVFSLTDEAVMYLGNILANEKGGDARLIFDGGNGKIGVNKNTVDNNYSLDVNGNTKVGGELNVTSKTTLGGELNTSNSAGTSGQVLISKGNNQAPEWKSLKEATGVISETKLIIGTNEITVNKGEEKNIPGLTYTITVPEGKEKLLIFNIVGYAAPNSDGGTQGVFELFHGDKKISSAYVAGVDSGDKYLRKLTGEPSKITTEYLAGRLMNTVVLSKIPVPATLMTNVALKPGTHNFVVKYKSWYGTSKINVNATNYDGATSEDNEALLSKMLITIYNVK
jgi:hypothetical protein